MNYELIEMDRTDKIRKQIISQCNVLIDGKYIDLQKDITLPYRESKNQRLINIQESLQENKIILLNI